ncbi:MAG TPA: MFS transporter [Dehalococcoidia bacterium]|nr:MFS transporter [Dehalococcoidia bacterium]
MKVSTNVFKFYAWSCVAGFYFMFTLQAIQPLSKGISMPELALFVGLTAMATTALEVPTGLLADRWSRKLAVSFGFASEGIGFAGYAFVESFWSLLPIAAFLAVGRSLKSGAAEAMIFEDLDSTGHARDYLAVTSRASSLRNVSGVPAAVAGPVLYVLAEPAPFLLSALASFIAALIVCTFDERRGGSARQEVQIMDGLRTILRSRALVLLASIEILVLVFVNTYYQVLFFPRLTSLGLEVEFLGFIDVVMLGLSSVVLLGLTRLTTTNAKLDLIAYTAVTAGTFVVFAVCPFLGAALVFGVLFDLAWTARSHVLPVLSIQYFESSKRALGLSSLSFVGNLGAAVLVPAAAAVFIWSYWYSVAPLALILGLLILLAVSDPNQR